jgi:hypothetical protein
MQELKLDPQDVNVLRMGLKHKIDSLEAVAVVGSPENTTSTAYDTTELKELLADLAMFIVARN